MLRLKTKSVYSLLRESKFKIVGKYFIVVYMYDEAITESAAGITVSKKVGKAVVRNKVKRRIKAVLKDFSLPLLTRNFYCNVIALSSSVDVEWAVFKGELERNLKQLTTDSC